MWKWLEKTKSVKDDLLQFKDEPLSGISIVLLIILDIFIFTNVIIGVEGETAKVPRVSYHYPSDCVGHFKQVKTAYKDFDTYHYGYNRSAHLRPHLNSLCQKLDAKIDVFTQLETFNANLEQIKAIEAKHSANKRRLDEISKNYNTRLFEKIAHMQNNTELVQVKSEYNSIVQDNHSLDEERSKISSVTSLQGYSAYVDFIKNNHTTFFEQKKHYTFWQPFMAYGHMLVFILPLLLLFGFFYVRTKKKSLAGLGYNPVVKIITAHISLILLLPLVWYSLGLIYHVLPKTLLKRVIEFLVEIGLVSLLNYVAILLVVGVFGLLIYWVQKRNAARRRMIVVKKDKSKLVSWSQCFECEYKIDYTKPYCPHCGTSLHRSCEKCQKQINQHERYCSHCGQAQG